MSAIDMDWVHDLVERHSDHIEGNTCTFHNGAYARMAEEIAATCEPWNTRSDHATQAANERKVDERDTVPVTKYQMALDDARKSNMDAGRWERIARDHQSKCESLKQTNADLRRIIDDMKAATVGNGTDLASRLRKVTGLRSFAELFGFSWEDGSDWDWHDVACAMADEIDATVGVGTCKDLGGVGADDEVVFNCSECGCVLSVFDKDGRNNLCTSFIYDYPRFCPECGARIIEEVTE